MLYRSGLQSLCVASLSLAFLMSLGCGGSGMTKVDGAVTLDGKPLEDGSISFEPADGKGPTAGGTIEAGEYAIEVPPGSKIVRITATKVVGQKPMYKGRPDSPMMEIRKDIIPPEYNTKSTLTLNVESSPTPGNFDLKSASAAKAGAAKAG